MFNLSELTGAEFKARAKQAMEYDKGICLLQRTQGRNVDVRRKEGLPLNLIVGFSPNSYREYV